MQTADYHPCLYFENDFSWYLKYLSWEVISAAFVLRKVKSITVIHKNLSHLISRYKHFSESCDLCGNFAGCIPWLLLFRTTGREQENRCNSANSAEKDQGSAAVCGLPHICSDICWLFCRAFMLCDSCF